VVLVVDGAEALAVVEAGTGPFGSTVYTPLKVANRCV
jgi:hypothetical protein